MATGDMPRPDYPSMMTYMGALYDSLAKKDARILQLEALLDGLTDRAWRKADEAKLFQEHMEAAVGQVSLGSAPEPRS